MSLTSDIAGDWQYIEGVESVEIAPVDPEGAGIRGVKGLLKATGSSPIQDAGVFATDTDDVTWHLWEATLQGYSPKNGDVICDSRGDEWTVVSAGRSIRSSRVIVNVRARV